MRIFCLLLACVAYAGSATAQAKCEASVNGFKIKTVYIMGDQPNGVAWAYKNLSSETCLTPTLDLEKADAILEVHRFWVPGSREDTSPISVSCTSRGASSFCSDSAGNVMTVDCAGGTCSSYYGPNPAAAAAGAFNAWLSTRWYESEVRLYTTDHKLLWKSEGQKGDWVGAQWPDKVRLGTSSPVCNVGYWSRPKYKNYRHWASTTCKVEFDPAVSIDVKVLARKADMQAKQAEADEMVRNAHDAAAKRQSLASSKQ